MDARISVCPEERATTPRVHGMLLLDLLGESRGGWCECGACWTQRAEDGGTGAGASEKNGDVVASHPFVRIQIRAKYPQLATLVLEITKVAKEAVATPKLHDDARGAARRSTPGAAQSDQHNAHQLGRSHANTTRSPNSWRRRGKRRALNSLEPKIGLCPREFSRHQPSRTCTSMSLTRTCKKPKQFQPRQESSQLQNEGRETLVRAMRRPKHEPNWTRPWTMPAAQLLAVSWVWARAQPSQARQG